MKTRPIGIYDSGVGGLTVLKALQAKFPKETFVYFGDTLNLPYGTKSREQIIHYSHKIISWLQKEMNVKLVVAACHTSSALALEEISSEFDVPIIGTIYPFVQNLLKNSHYKRIGIIATPASAKSLMHETILKKYGFQGEIFSIGCSDFVPLIEAQPWDLEALKKAAEDYLKEVKDQLDVLLYACTHYPFIKPIIEGILPNSVKHIDPADFVTIEVLKTLSEKNLLTDADDGNSYFYVSHAPQEFSLKVQKFLRTSILPPVVLKNIS